MRHYQRDFLNFAIQRGVLRFGNFTLKSGRVSPYFFNAGLFNSGDALVRLGRFYAQAVIDSGIEFDLLFGPAYKGIPLAAATAIALADQYGQDRPYCFNRKEAKDHGEGGNIVGSPLEGRVLVVDDVITAGTAVRQAADIIAGAGARLTGIVVALDRQEKGQGTLSAIQEVERDYGISVVTIVTLADILFYLKERGELGSLEAVAAYRAHYGV